MEQDNFWKYLPSPKRHGTKNETNTIGNYNSRPLKGIKRRIVCTRRDFVEEKFQSSMAQRGGEEHKIVSLINGTKAPK